MSLKARLIIVLSLVTALYVGLTHGIQRLVIFPSFVLHERDHATSALQRCQDAIRREIYHLDLFCDDWAAWDDTYAFVGDRNPQYAQSNLLHETFTGNGLNLIYVVASDGTVVWGKILDLETEEEVELQQFPASTFPAGHPLLAHDTTDSSISGIIQTDLGPMLFASRPIITSEDEGPIRGSLLMGRRVDQAFVEMIAEQSDVDLQLWSVQDESMPADASGALALMGDDGHPFLREQGEKQLAAYATLPDLYAPDTPSLLLRTTIPREITAQGDTVLRFAQI